MRKILTVPFLALLTSSFATACVDGSIGEFDEDLEEYEDEDEELTQIGAAPAFENTERDQLNYVVVAHPDDEFASWALIENSSANYNVFINLTRGERTNYCTSFAGYAPSLGEFRPGNRFNYENVSCGENRIGSSVKFFREMAKIDPYIGPAPTRRYQRRGVTLPAGTPGATCTPSSTSFEIRPGRNMALVYFDLGDGDLERCEVEWALSQVRRLRGTELLPSLREYGVIAASFYNDRHPDCTRYDHPDHRKVHEAIFQTNFGTPGPQYGRTCSTDPDAVRIDRVDQYSAMAMSGNQRVGAFQRAYGWLQSAPWASGSERVSQFSQDQAFWRRY